MKEAGFPCISNINYPSCNMVPADVPKLKFVLHTSGALDLVQTRRIIVTFSLVDILRKDIKSTEYMRWGVYKMMTFQTGPPVNH